MQEIEQEIEPETESARESALESDVDPGGDSAGDSGVEQEQLGDPAVLGVPTFVVGSIAFGLTLVGYAPATAIGAPLAILVCATGLGQLIAAVWAACIADNAKAVIFGLFGGFWISYAALVLGLVHGWYGIGPADAAAAQSVFLISWIVTLLVLLLGTLRLPAAYTLLFLLIEIALLLELLGTLTASIMLTTAGGYVVFTFALIGLYLFLDTVVRATGGKPLPLGKPVLAG